jgi:adenosylhomocysteinase
LAEAGQRKLVWVEQHSPVLQRLAATRLADGALRGVRVSVVVHLEAKTAYLALVLARAGAIVTASGSNPSTTQDAVTAALARQGVRVFATHGCPPAEFEAQLLANIDTAPEVIVDDGAELTQRLLRHRPELARGLRGVTEETTTGVARLRDLESQGQLEFPAIAANDAALKHLFDNRYGTGQSTFEAILATTNLLLAGRRVVVIGYGWCGRGLARAAAGLDARVLVCELDPIKALEAHCDGCTVLPLMEACRDGELFISATGAAKVLGGAHYAAMRGGAIVANAGHSSEEIDLAALAALAVRTEKPRPHIEAFVREDGSRIYLLAGGELVNIAAGDGHPVEIMDLSFSVQALAAHRLAAHGRALGRGVLSFPAELDREIAAARLETR